MRQRAGLSAKPEQGGSAIAEAAGRATRDVGSEDIGHDASLRKSVLARIHSSACSGIVGELLTLNAIILGGVAMAWLVLDIKLGNRTGNAGWLVAAAIVGGIAIGWIAADVERAYRSARRRR